jgi:hypothetical protein
MPDLSAPAIVSAARKRQRTKLTEPEPFNLQTVTRMLAGRLRS